MRNIHKSCVRRERNTAQCELQYLHANGDLHMRARLTTASVTGCRKILRRSLHWILLRIFSSETRSDGPFVTKGRADRPPPAGKGAASRGSAAAAAGKPEGRCFFAPGLPSLILSLSPVPEDGALGPVDERNRLLGAILSTEDEGGGGGGMRAQRLAARCPPPAPKLSR